MKILIDATPLLLQSAGVKGYLFDWIKGLRAWSGPAAIETWPHLELRELDHEHSLGSKLQTLIGVSSFLASYRLRLPVYDYVLPTADVFHACILQNSVPKRRRVTSTIFDMTPLLMPEFHTTENVASFRAHAENVLKRAHALISISEHSRQDAMRLLGLPPSRIITIPCIIQPRFFEATDQQAAAVASRLGLAKPYVLSVGSIEPRKNIDRLLDAWLSLRPDLRNAFELVLAGHSGWRSQSTLRRLKASPPGIRQLGYVAEELLPGLHRGAALLAYPSLYEGFGLPAAQSLACGRPVLASNVSSLPEVVGPGGVLVDPMSTSEIAAGLTRLLEDASVRESYAAAGQDYVRRRCSAEPVARASLRFFEQVAG